MVASSDATLVQGRSFDAKTCCKCASDGRPSTPSKVLQIQCLVLKTDLACSPAAGWTPFDAPIDTAGEDMRQYDIRIRAQNAAYEAPSRGTFRFFVSTSQPYPPIPISSPSRLIHFCENHAKVPAHHSSAVPSSPAYIFFRCCPALPIQTHHTGSFPPPPRPPARFQENKLSEHEYFRQCQMPHVRVHNMGYFNSAHGPKFNGSWLDRPYPYIARFAAEGMSAGT